MDHLRRRRFEREAAKLWRLYQADRTNGRRNQIVDHYSYLVPITASRIYRCAEDAEQIFSVDDRISLAYQGLIEAVQSYQPARGIRFQTWAICCIRNKIRMGLRDWDWVPRRERDRMRDYERSVDNLTLTLMRSPTIEEIANRMGVDIDTVFDIQSQFIQSTVGSLDYNDPEWRHENGSTLTDTVADPNVRIEQEAIGLAFACRIEEAAKDMDTELVSILMLRYVSGLQVQQVCGVLGISHTTYKRNHDLAIETLKAFLSYCGGRVYSTGE